MKKEAIMILLAIAVLVIASSLDYKWQKETAEAEAMYEEQLAAKYEREQSVRWKQEATVEEAETIEVQQSEEEQIAEEEYLGELETLAQLVEAEAGNQDIHGKMLVACVVLNRVEDEAFPDTITEVIYQSGQFTVISNGAFEAAAYNISDSSFEAVRRVAIDGERVDAEILYFCSTGYNGPEPLYKYQDHYFSK